jgi:hypothetical protein
LDQLETAAQPNHRQILLRALNAIESELETLTQAKENG